MLDIVHQTVHLLQNLNLIPVLPTLSVVFSAAQSVHMCSSAANPKVIAQIPIPLMLLDDAAQCVHIRSSAANPKAHRPGSHTFDDAGCRTTCTLSSPWKL